MSTSADEPTRPTVPRSEQPTLKPGELSPNDATRATTPARPGMSDTRATVPAMVSGTAATQVAGPGGLSSTKATALHVDGPVRPVDAATGSHEGEQWGDFHVGRLLGRGGMGAVYAGRQVSLDRPVAIKVLIGHLAQNEDFRKRFLLEARAAARINSPHVVQVYFAGTHGDMDFFAMEYVEGSDLSRKLKDGWRPTPSECLALIIQATRSLVALGEHRIVHRDIKPANYMLTTAGMVKLMDFGLVKFASEAHGLTQTGTIMGTVNYFSPEQGRGEVCDQRTDIYALGVMFYEMLTGKLPFTGGDATSVIYQHIHVEPKPPKIHNPAVTEPYQSVVLKCLEKEAKNRYQTARDLLDDLERISRGERPQLLGGVKRTASGSVVTTTSRKLTLAAAVIIAAVILALALLLRPAAATVTVAANEPIPTTTTTSPTVNDPPPVATVAPTTPAVTPPPAKPVEVAPAVSAPPVVIVPAQVKTPEPPPVTTPTAAPVVVAAVTPPPVIPQPTQAPTPPPAKPVVEAAVVPPVVVEAPAKPVVPSPVVVEAPAKPVLPPPVVEPVVAKPVNKPTPPTPTKPVPVVVAPAKPTTPAPLSTQVQSTLRITIPAGDALLQSSTWLWWIEGPSGRSGRLSARSTRRPEIEWTAPALPSSATLHVAAIGSERHLTIPLVATAAAGPEGTLTPFLRANFADERHVQRLRRDFDGSWWLVDVDEAIVSRNTDGWLTGGRFQPTPPTPRPVAVASTPTGIAVLDSDQPSLLLYGRDGAPGRSITGFQRPVDVVALADGTWAVADMRSGGVLVVDQQGVRVRTYLRTSTGGFSNLVRLASEGRLLLALDAGEELVAVFDGDNPLPTTTWKLERGSRPVAITMQAGKTFVLSASGEIIVLDRAGKLVQKLPSAVVALPDESLGVPTDITVDSTGDIYITYPAREMIARHSPDGKQLSIRHARTWTWRAYAADGANRLYGIDAEHRRVVVLDAEGWRQGTLGKALSKGGTFDSPLTLAAHPDGAAVAVLDEETLQVTRFDLTNGTHLVFGGKGKNDGQFDSPLSLAMDQDGRTYVLDIGLHRVSVFDAKGGFLRHIGRYERGDAPDMLRTPRLIAVTPDGTSLFVFDEDAALVKRFAIDHATNQVRHVGNFGGRGTGPGQFSRITGMGCDRRGRLYCLDYKRADLQVFDATSNTPTLITGLRGETAGIRKMLNLALNPDGIPLIIGGDQLTGLRWQR